MTIPYRDEVEFRRAVLKALLLPQPAAPAPPAEMFIKDAHGEYIENPECAAWRAALAEWGALPEVRRNGWVLQVVEAHVFAWSQTGQAPNVAVGIGDFFYAEGKIG